MPSPCLVCLSSIKADISVDSFHNVRVYYLDEGLSFVFNSNNVELSDVRQLTPYWRINNTSSCLSVP